MARGATFKLDGIRGLEQALERASDQIRVNVGRANRITAQAIHDRATANVPKDRGDLARAISVQGRDLNWKVGLLDSSIPSRGGSNSAHLNPWVYGQFIEFGTRRYSARPFMGPAVDAARGPHEARLRSALTTAVRRVGG